MKDDTDIDDLPWGLMEQDGDETATVRCTSSHHGDFVEHIFKFDAWDDDDPHPDFPIHMRIMMQIKYEDEPTNFAMATTYDKSQIEKLHAMLGRVLEEVTQ